MNERLSNIIKNQATIPTVVGVLAFGVGAVGGYILGRRNKYEHSSKVSDSEQLTFDEAVLRLENKYDKPHPAIEDVVTAHEEEQTSLVSVIDVTQLSSDEEADTEWPIHKADEVVVERNVGERLPTMAPDPEVDRRSIFAANDDDWDYAVEMQHRTENAPYVLHRDEFYSDEEEFDQNTLTYYAGDDILVDDADAPIYNYHTILGDLKFGHGSGDPNVVYIRNHERKAEYEVLHDPGFYTVEVLGLAAEEAATKKELRHAHLPRRFRQED